MENQLIKSSDFFPVRIVNYNRNFLNRYRDMVQKVRFKREEYRKLLAVHLNKTYGNIGLWNSDVQLSDLTNVALLLSSPRGGSSATINILSQQASKANKNDRIIVVLPGETKPHLLLSSFYFPFNNKLSDELTFFDARKLDPFTSYKKLATKYLRNELLCEVGYPIQRTKDLLGFAIRIYGRLLLQWPEIEFGPPEYVIGIIKKYLKNITNALGTPGEYIDSKKYRRHLFTLLCSYFQKISIDLYDGIENYANSNRSITSSRTIPSVYQIEEAPFIIPKPWNYVNCDEIDNTVLFLKDTSDAARILFWKKIFYKSQLFLFHLTRDPREVINGLCEGWNFPFGFQTIPLPFEFHICGYSDTNGCYKNTLNFSVYKDILALLYSRKSVDLEYIAAVQWASAHNFILQNSSDELYWRIGSFNINGKKGFEYVRENPSKAIKEICSILNVPITKSFQNSILLFPNELIMSMNRIEPKPNRWIYAKNSTKIESIVNQDFVKILASRLEYYL